MNKENPQTIIAEIRQVLVNMWDPIGIKDVPEAQDEYDAYIGGVFDLLNKRASEEDISAYLWKVIGERIHRHPERGATEEAVKALRRIRIE
jgi:hypothetical protein